jgi:hypothetical protein
MANTNREITTESPTYIAAQVNERFSIRYQFMEAACNAVTITQRNRVGQWRKHFFAGCLSGILHNFHKINPTLLALYLIDLIS